MSAEEKRIREFAYQIWESEGKPEGQEDRHWSMARKLAEAEALAPKASPRKPRTTPPGAPPTGANGKARPSAAAPKAKPAAPVAKADTAKKPRTAKKPATP